MTTPERRLTDAEHDALEEREALRKLRFRRAKAIRANHSALSKTVFKEVVPQLKEKGSSVSALEANWSEIVGPRLAGLTRPVRIARGKAGRILIIEAPSAAAPMIQHQSGLILQRAQLGGGGNLKALKVQQTQTPAQKTKKNKHRERRDLSAEERAHLEQNLSEIESPTLRKALTKLGEAIITRR